VITLRRLFNADRQVAIIFSFFMRKWFLFYQNAEKVSQLGHHPADPESDPGEKEDCSQVFKID